MKDIADPLKLKDHLWPHVYFYREQRRIIYSVWENDETYVPAANVMGKDFVGGFICLAFFLTRNPVRIVTTSAKDDHLRVLWGEIGRYIQTSKYPLDHRQGGPLIVNHQDIRKLLPNGQKCSISYLIGMVASKDTMAAMQGHHATPDNVEDANDGIPRTLFVSDESSSVPNEYKTMANTWAKRHYIFGNTWPCENFWKQGVQGGDVLRPNGKGYYRKVIRIRAQDSPNVRYGLAQKALGIEPDNRVLVPGVKSYEEYVKNRMLWDRIQQCVSLDAEFYEGAELKLFPPLWLNRAQQLAAGLRGKQRKAKAIGIDPAEGGDKTSMTAVDEFGIIEQVARKTPNTNDIVGEAIAFGRKHGVEPENWVFDRGGGGKEHADRLRAMGYHVRTVAFGETLTPIPKRGLTILDDRIKQREERTYYVNRRAEMYGIMSSLCDPSLSDTGFAIPAEYTELIFQLSKFPRKYDEEGRLWLPPKNKKNPDSKVQTLVELIGHSPDEADSTVLAVHGLVYEGAASVASAF